MNQILAVTYPQTQREAPQRVVRACRDYRRQFDTLRKRTRSDARCRCPGWIWDFLTHTRGAHRRFQPQLTNPERIDLHDIFARREIIESQLGEVHHNAFTRRIREQHLRRNGNHRARRGIDRGNGIIGFEDQLRRRIKSSGNRL
ncbi:hypothetical protein D3C76_1437710 [compost metagenome]